MKLLQYLPLSRPLAIKALLKKLSNNNVSSILDLEDSIQDVFSKKKTNILKKQARKNLIWISNNVSELKNTNKVFVRINSINTIYFNKDLEAIKEIALNSNFKIDGLFLPKIEDYSQIIYVYNYFKKLKIKLLMVPIIETVKGLNNLENILNKDLNNNVIYGVHYGHFDYCLDANFWPLPDPFHIEFWEIIDKFAYTISKYNKLYFHTPFPFLKNIFLFWGSEKYLRSNYKNFNFCLTSINIDISLSKKPDNVEKFKLKHISKSIDYHITHAQNIVNIFLENRVNQRSFAISDKRFIPPHQYEMAKKFLKEKNTI